MAPTAASMPTTTRESSGVTRNHGSYPFCKYRGMSVVGEQVAVGLRWLTEGRRVMCALLVDAEGSSPFAPGAFMLIDGEGAIEGSITGGCVEADVVTNALEIQSGNEAPRLLPYGVSDQLAHSVGLMCGGTVEVFVHELRGTAREVCAEAFDAVAREVAVGVATVLDGPLAGAKLAVVEGRVLGGFGGPELLDHTVARDLVSLDRVADQCRRRYGAAARRSVVVQRAPASLRRAFDARARWSDRLLVRCRGARQAGRLSRRDRRCARGVRAR